MSVKPIPDGYHSLTPYLIVRGGVRAIDFYKQAFGAVELFRVAAPGGSIGHAEMTVGSSIFMLGDECPAMGASSPETIGGTPVGLMLYVENVDEVVARAIAAGGKILKPVSDQFYGDRSGTVQDPFGHQWTVATHVEDVPADELARRAAAAWDAVSANAGS